MEIITTFSAQTAMRFKLNKHVSQCYTIVYLVLCGADYTTLRTPFVFTHPVLNIPIITDSIPGGNIIMLQQPDTPPEVVLNCTVEAHPTPSLTWTRDDGNSVDQQQVMTEPREMAFSSLLTVPSTQLAGRVEFTCTADVMGTTAQSSIAITAYCELLRIHCNCAVHSVYLPSSVHCTCFYLCLISCFSHSPSHHNRPARVSIPSHDWRDCQPLLYCQFHSHSRNNLVPGTEWNGYSVKQ